MRTSTSCPMLFEAVRTERQPILETFACGCASTITATVSSVTPIRIDDRPAFFIAHPDVIYHADRDKEKCDLRRKATGIVEWKGQNQPEIELNDASVPSHTRTGRQNLFTPSFRLQ